MDLNYTMMLIQENLHIDSCKAYLHSLWIKGIAKKKIRKYWKLCIDFTSSWDEFTETSINQFQEIERFEELSDDHYRFITGLLISQELDISQLFLQNRLLAMSFSNIQHG